MSVSWKVKVEYCGDKTETIVDASWIKDFEECPAFDPHRVYRGFWSPVDEDSPQSMLKRVPAIPDLSEEEEKRNLPGYYRISILGVEDNSDKFELTRSRKSTQRGTKVEERSSNSRKRSSSSKSGKSKTSSSSAKPSGTSSKADDAKKNQANRANVGSNRAKSVNYFEKVDKANEGDFDSDDSLNDPTLVSDIQVKVLQSSVKNLKAKLIEKCKEKDELKKEVASRDAELTKLRNLNTGLQEKILDAFPSALMGRPISLPSSRSSSVSSSRTSSYERLPLCSRSRTVSSSSMSSCSSVHRFDVSSKTSAKRKTPPSSPKHTAKKCSGWPGSSDSKTEGSRPLHDKSPASALSTSVTMEWQKTKSHPPANSERSNERSSTTDQMDSSIGSQDPPLSSPLKQQNSMDSSSVTITNSTDHEQSFADDVDTDVNPALANDLDKTDSNLVEFCKGFKVDKAMLEKIESRPLSATEDGSYVKELSVLVFTHKTLYNSSLKERKYNKAEEENKTPRKMLDLNAVEAIRQSLEKRVWKEFKNQVPPKETARYSKSKVNRTIYEKIKKMRKNPHLKNLEEGYSSKDIQSEEPNDNTVTEEASKA